MAQETWQEVEASAPTLEDLTRDSDGDGIVDDRELALGTNPRRADTDRDGFSDSFEDVLSELGFDPRARTADGDRDGLPDEREQALRTNRRRPDSDGDGWGDFDEELNRSFGFNPRLATKDSDFDGLADRLERQLGISPRSVDSDGDGVTDFQEVRAGLNPAVPDEGGLGEAVGITYSPAMARALEEIRHGGAFPRQLAAELPYPAVTAPLVSAGVVRPSAALMQLAVYNPTAATAALLRQSPSPGLYDAYDEIVRKMGQAAASSNDIVRLFRWSRRTVDCCDANGRNKPGRRLYALKISDNPRTNEDEPELLFMGMHHARELITTTIALSFLDELTGKYAAGDPTIRGLVDHAEIWIIPVVNPDGYTKAVGELTAGAIVDWRKNTRRVTERTPTGARQDIDKRGVDLNRNYGFEHIRSLPANQRRALTGLAKSRNGLDGNAEFDPDDETYAGKSAFSEVESRAVRGLAANRFATGSEVDGLRCSLSWHSYGGEVLHPLSHTLNGLGADTQPFKALADVVADATKYINLGDQYQLPQIGYPVYGDSEDWLYKAQQVFALTVEAYSQGAHPGSNERGGVGPDFFPDGGPKRDAVAKNNVGGGLALVGACCRADFGDADPRYPVKLRDQGARHTDTGREWLGRFLQPEATSVSRELDAVDPIDSDGVPNVREDLMAPDLDRFDDGVLLFPLTYRPGEQGKAEFTVCVEKPGDRYDAADPDKVLYVNAWIDWNTDGRWGEANQEHILDGLKLAPTDVSSWAPRGLRNAATTVTQLQTAVDGKCALYEARFPVGQIGTNKLWARFRLDYGEDAGRNDPRPLFRPAPSLRLTRGEARYGEVEDYRIGSDFGDAPDPYLGNPGQYPTRREPAGARHLDFTREWLGKPGDDAAATRETDGCDITEAEEDGVPNLGASCASADADRKDDGAVVPAFVQPGQTVSVEIDVSARIDAFGFANRGPAGEDSKGVPTLKPDCTLKPIADAPDTPPVHRDRGRYAAWDPARRLYLNVWADWNADGEWQDSERVISGPLDPEDWGAAGGYTLGEPFTDADGNGVRTSGEAFSDVAGETTRHLSCPVQVPLNVALGRPFYWRFRLDYGENAATRPAVAHHATEDGRALDRTRGGALWGEVEDYKSLAVEIDDFPQTTAFVTVVLPQGAQQVTLTGPATVVVDIGNPADTDGDGREQVKTEMVRLSLQGPSPLGPVSVRLRDPAKHPFQRSTGEIEEQVNLKTGRLDLPPFSASGTAESFFNVFFEIEIGDRIFHSHEPERVEAVIRHKPPTEPYFSPQFVELFDEDEQASGVRLGEVTHVPQATTEIRQRRER